MQIKHRAHSALPASNYIISARNFIQPTCSCQSGLLLLQVPMGSTALLIAIHVPQLATPSCGQIIRGVDEDALKVLSGAKCLSVCLGPCSGQSQHWSPIETQTIQDPSARQFWTGVSLKRVTFTEVLSHIPKHQILSVQQHHKTFLCHVVGHSPNLHHTTARLAMPSCHVHV